MDKITVADKIEVLAGAIRSLARKSGYDPNNLTKQQAEDFGELQGYNYNTLAGKFYREATDSQWRRVLKILGVK